MNASDSFRRYGWFTLIFCVFVILWGAFVRASGSGAGCGAHWPLCNGDIVPVAPSLKTSIEYIHRVTSGLSLLLVIALYIWAKKLFAKGTIARRAAFFSLVAIFIEAAIGAALVLLHLVEHDQSLDRAISIALHLVNTLFLLAVLLATIFFARSPDLKIIWSKAEKNRAYLLILGFAFLGALGALTALGDTLFRPASLAAGWEAHSAAHSHFLEKIRIIHPLLAVFWSTAVVIWAVGWKAKLPQYWPEWRRLLILIGINILAGIANILLLAPVWLQIVHLLIANLIWLQFMQSVLCAAAYYPAKQK